MKKIILIFSLLLLVSCNKVSENIKTSTEKPVAPNLNTIDNNVIQFSVTEGAGAENIKGVKVEIFDKFSQTILTSYSDANGVVTIKLPEDNPRTIDIVLSKEGYGQTRIQDYFLEKNGYLRDVYLFKQPLFNFTDAELAEKNITRPVAIAPYIDELKIISNKDAKKEAISLANGQNYKFDELSTIKLELTSHNPIGDDGHKWKGIRANTNNPVDAYSPKMNTDVTAYKKVEDKLVYNGSISLSSQLLKGDNFYEIVAQDTGGNQVIKRVYFQYGTLDDIKYLDTANVVIRNFEFKLIPHNHGHTYLPYRSISSYNDDEKSDITTNRRLTLDFSVADKKTGEDLPIRGYIVHYSDTGIENWKLLEKVIFPTINHGKVPTTIPNLTENSELLYEKFSYRNFDSSFDTNKFYSFKVVALDAEQNAIGESNVVSGRFLDYFSISPTTEYKTYAKNAKDLYLGAGPANLNFKFGFQGLKDLEKSYNKLSADKKASIDTREVLFGLDMSSYASGLASHITTQTIRTGIPFVAKYDPVYDSTGKIIVSYNLNFYNVSAYKEMAFRISSDVPDYYIPGGKYSKLQSADEIYQYLNFEEINANDGLNNSSDYKVNLNLNNLWGGIVSGKKVNGVTKKVTLPGITFNTEFIRPSRTYQWDIAGHPVLTGSHDYSSATYQEVYVTNKVLVNYDLNGDSIIDGKDFIPVTGASKVAINSKSNTPDGSYTVNITE